ncbi:MAG: alanine racemase [Solirubrobacteraceae bacterium]|nr:alanine racemase [Solirubrobacteraceae bacterium]
MSVRRRAVARIDGGAFRRNVARVAGEAPRTELCAVVKADGYGHGAVGSARAALAGGATWLAVATAAEAISIRDAGIDARLIVLGALSDSELPQALACDVDLVVWREQQVARIAALGGARLHVKLDTGMGRLGTRDVEEASRVATAAATTATTTLAGLMTHFATADERGDRFFSEQLERFRAWALPLRERHPQALLHAANSAALLRDPASHFDLVRPGVALYGMDPFGEDPDEHRLEPVLRVESYVAEVKPCVAGESVGYGRRFVAARATWVATVPVGYGDGWRRALSGVGNVLVRGRRFPIVGAVSMDNVTLDLGPDGAGVRVGDEAVLLGSQGAERILAEHVAEEIGTINYEVTCGLGSRIPRVHEEVG